MSNSTRTPQERLAEERQAFFEPFYLEIIREHPNGVASNYVHEETQRRVKAKYGFDPYDGEEFGVTSHGVPKPVQWARNLVSNKVLVSSGKVRESPHGERQVMLYPVS